MVANATNTADALVPLPLVDGPKLNPFDFKGVQNIEFLDSLGAGAHSEVFKVKILGELYALKVVRVTSELRQLRKNDNRLNSSSFAFPDTIDNVKICNEVIDREATEAIHQYVDPFYAECRAYGRLQETGHEDLALKCHGYVLLDSKHEEALRGKEDREGSVVSYRPFYVHGDEEPPRVRCIIKELGSPLSLTQGMAYRLLDDVKSLHQLGITGLDLKLEQIINGKIADFSMALTFPHFVMSPQLDLNLPIEWRQISEVITWRHFYWDYIGIHEIVNEWNDLHADHPETKIAFSLDSQAPRYGLRKLPGRRFMPVDPRSCIWERRKARRRQDKRGRRDVQKVRLFKNPPRWHFNRHALDELNKMQGVRCNVAWEYRNGVIFPKGGGYQFAAVDGVIQKVSPTPFPETCSAQLKKLRRLVGQQEIRDLARIRRRRLVRKVWRILERGFTVVKHSFLRLPSAS